MHLFLKGFIIGLGKIIPGVSGSVLAITLGVYEKSIMIISNLKNNFLQNISFLYKLGLGIILGIILGSKVLAIFFNHYYYYTLWFIIGLISSSIFEITKKIGKIKKIDLLFFIILIIGVILINNIQLSLKINNIIIVLIGYIDALTMIIPGISGTAIFMILGVYEYFLYLLSHVSIDLIFYTIGLVIGIIITSKIISYGFKHYYHEIHILILYFIILSILMLFKMLVPFIKITNIWFGIFLFFAGFLISYFFREK